MHNCTTPPRIPSTLCHMRIGIIGSGKMGAGLGRLWVEHGHNVSEMPTFMRWMPAPLQNARYIDPSRC